jgi:hypothetical protein
MKTTRIAFVLSIISVLIVGCQTGKMVPGLYWEQTTEIVSVSGDTMKYDQRFYLIPDKFRSERLGPNNETFLIVRMDKEIMLNGSPADSLYKQVPFEEIIRRLEARKESIRRMRAQMDTLPPNLRARMEGDVGVKWEPERYVANETGEKKNISGINCEKLIVTNRDSLEGEYWVTKDFGSLDTYGKNWLGIMGMVIASPQFDKHKLINEKGILIAATVGRTKITVTKMEKKQIPESLFDAPDYYKKIEVPVFKPRLPQKDSVKSN